MTGWTGLALATGLWGCVDATSSGPEQQETPLEDLRPAGSCEDLRGRLATRALVQMEHLLKRNHALAISAAHDPRPLLLDDEVDAVGAPSQPEPDPDPDQGGGEGAGGNFAGGAERGDDGAIRQEAAVDEADRIELQDGLLYVLTDVGLEIVRVAPVDQAGPVAVLRIDGGRARSLFVDGDRAVIYVDRDAAVLPLQEEAAVFGPYGAPPAIGGLCPFGVGCDLSSGSNRALRILTVDLTDPAAPTVIRDVKLNGSYVAARRIEQVVHTVVEFPPPVVRGVKFWPDELAEPFGNDPEVARAAFDALRDRNIQILTGRPLADWLPGATDVRRPGAADERTVAGLLEDCDSVWYAHLQDGRGFVSVVSQTMAGDRPLETETVISEPGAVYVTGDALYLATRQRFVVEKDWFDAVPDNNEATIIHRFDLRLSTSVLDPDGRPVVQYAGSSAVPGLLLNRFAMRAAGDGLEVLSTIGFDRGDEVPDPIVEVAPEYGDVVTRAPGEPAPDVEFTRGHRLTVLGRNSIGRLSPQGFAELAATNVDPTAVRFVDQWALLAFGGDTDLQIIERPAEGLPRVRGTLPVQGAPQFLHPLGDGLLLSVAALGGEVTTDDERAAGPGLAVELFDLSDPDRARALGGVSYAGAGSAALSDPLAVRWASGLGALALPVQTCGDTPFNGLQLLTASAQGGLQVLGQVDHSDADEAACGPAQVQRSAFQDDTVLSVGLNEVRVAGLADWQIAARVPLEGATARSDDTVLDGSGMGSRDGDDTPDPVDPDGADGDAPPPPP
ncbi:MAG: beta-propeller domain-containing protein [Myxococcales bacterium]|nr:beta-propeller domain-containing protein [Myxococcales bacterium]MCB9525377.1 beta-propeller domain-containing protein [Myxococcales bacterium]